MARDDWEIKKIKKGEDEKIREIRELDVRASCSALDVCLLSVPASLQTSITFYLRYMHAKPITVNQAMVHVHTPEILNVNGIALICCPEISFFVLALLAG
jgi:hypothetical protein